jgi:photosystem II stability/assembly factor-like uncharacterized protein
MKKLTLLICLSLVSGFAFAQWTWQNPLPKGDNLNCIRFVDATTGYAVGDAGTIIKTTDGGLTWTIQNSGTYFDLYSVYFTDTNTGYVTGGDTFWESILLKTTNGGMSWSVLTTGYERPYKSIHFVNADTGYFVGNGYLEPNIGDIIFKTTDGGKNWTKKMLESNYGLSSICFTDEDTGYALGETFWKTTDGGENWIYQNNVSGKSVFFTDAKTGYIAGDYGKILKTTNAGTSWELQHTDSTYSLTSVFFTDSNTGYAVGGDNSKGVILKTRDAGVSWTNVIMENLPLLASIYFNKKNTGFAVGKGGAIIQTTDGGTEWSFLSSKITSKNLNSTSFLNVNTGYAVGEGGTILKTIDGGSMWTHLNSGTSQNLYAVCFNNVNTGFAVGESGCILKTNNGGESWTTQVSGSNVSLRSVHFPVDDIGYAVGDSMVLSTNDGGLTWTGQSLLRGRWDSEGFKLNSVFFTSADTGFVVGHTGGWMPNGKLYKTVNGGKDWTILTPPELGYFVVFYSVFFTNAKTGYVSGLSSTGMMDGYPTILKTIDGGLTWNNYFCGITGVIYFPDADTGYIVGGGAIQKTTDGGTTWSNPLYVTGNALHSISFPNSETGYIVGDNGTILKTTNGGGLVSAAITQKVESTFTIYPNPATNKISIATNSNQQGETTICIFNMNGALLQQTKFQSQNLIELDVSNLTKGIYLVKIQTNKGIETKKLVVQ